LVNESIAADIIRVSWKRNGGERIGWGFCSDTRARSLALISKLRSSGIVLTFAVMIMMVIVAVNVSEMRSGGTAYLEVLKAMADARWKLRRWGHEA
jgi:hypothetical protein